ncbi:MAG: response regulator [Anaerolineae bacterium]|nr:response regulator [Anaerolineae bacterium]
MQTKRILIVDDEHLTGIALADYLQEEGFIPTVVENAQAAIEAQKEQPFNVCIVDIRMPGMDGVEATLALHKIAPMSHFIICTGSPEFTVPSVLKQIGLTQQAVVTKPILDMEIFIALLKSWDGQG